MKRSQREKELRAIVRFIEQLTVFKSNGYHRIEAYGGGLSRRPREHFLDYCERVRAAFPKKHRLPPARMRRYWT